MAFLVSQREPLNPMVSQGVRGDRIPPDIEAMNAAQREQGKCVGFDVEEAMVSRSTEGEFVRSDTDDPNSATCWAAKGQPGVDWNDDTNMVVVGLDRLGKVLAWNERAQELTNLKEDEVVGYSFARKLLSCSLALLVEKLLNRAWAGEDVGCFEIPFFTKSGCKLQLLVSLSISGLGPSEQLVLKAVSADDARWYPAANDIPTMTAHVDLDGRVTEWDTCAYDICEFAHDEMIGKMFVSTLVPAQQREQIEDAFMQVQTGTEHEFGITTQIHTKSGKKQRLWIRVVPKYTLRSEKLTRQLAGLVVVGHMIGEQVTTHQD